MRLPVISVFAFLPLIPVLASNMDNDSRIAEETILLMVEKDKQVPQDQALWEASRSDVLSKKGNYLPTLEMGYRKDDLLKREAGISSTIGSTYSLSTSLNLFRFGKDWWNLKASQRASSALEMKRNSSLLAAESKAAQLVLDHINNVKLEALLERMVEIKKNSLKVAEILYQKGLSPEQDITKMEIDLGNARARLSDIQTARMETLTRIRSIVGTDSNITLVQNWPWPDLLSANTRIWIEKIDIENTAPSRPDLQSAALNVERDQYLLQSSKAAFLPNVNLSYEYTKYADLKYPSSNSADKKLILTVNIPLFSGFKDYASHAEATAHLTISRYQREQVLQQAKEEILIQKGKTLNAFQNFQERERTLIAAKKLYANSANLFQKGKMQVQDLFSDQERLLTSETLHLEAQANFYKNFVALCTATGRSIFGCIEEVR